MNTTVLKIVLDTNILIAIIGRKSPFRWIFDQIIAGQLILCVSNEILLEYQEILERKTSQEVADNLIHFLTIHPFVVKTDIFYQFHLISEDEDDNKFVDCAIAANAVCLVSNDKHFKVLKTIKFPKVNLLTLPEFVQEFKDGLT
ncbi:MAG: putative toxin-antitoxin system toxin component, PIN family [Thiomargarita sp.]|nr:putative toxin-antitoxin system toxin component, PIN family [Thiomargarita sp.]